MSLHPFRLPYLGLGLRDDASIARDSGAWVAHYPDVAGRPYLRLRVADDGLTDVEEFDRRGRSVARTRESSLVRALGRHGAESMAAEAFAPQPEDPPRLWPELPGCAPTPDTTPAPSGATISRFWLRATGGGLSVWCPLTWRGRYGFVPAVGLASVHIPCRRGSRWVPPEPGLLATRLGIDFALAGRPRPAILVRWGADGARTDEQVTLRTITVPAILLRELAAALAATEGAAASRGGHVPATIEWRAYATTDVGMAPFMAWSVPEPFQRPDLVRFAIEGAPRSRPASARRSGRSADAYRFARSHAT